VRDLPRLIRRRLVTIAPVLTEACALLPYAVQRRRLRRVLSDFAIAAYPLDEEATLWMEILGWMDQYQEREPDWTDAYLAVLSGREKQAAVWTYDREFTSIWRRPDGSPIPLAVK
jgi:predicted nucleic acid-binding protein